MKATLRHEDQSTGYPLGEVDVRDVEQVLEALANIDIYDQEDTGTRYISVQIDDKEGVLDFVWSDSDV